MGSFRHRRSASKPPISAFLTSQRDFALASIGFGIGFVSSRPARLARRARPARHTVPDRHGDPARALQTGYELAVMDARGRGVWSSGPVASASRRGVPYGGQELDDDTDYAWRVRLRDAAGIFGPWSGSQPFSTGLADTSWDADWIRRASGGLTYRIGGLRG